jgi:alpha-L-rhamnosidase
VSPCALRVEYERDPDNVPVAADLSGNDELPTLAPRFAWHVTGSRGATQSAYRVVVDTNPESLTTSEDPFWDSGIVTSSQSLGIVYDGPSLEPDRQYYWAVRLYDADGLASDWSSTATFTTAPLYAAGTWDGSWIGPDYGDRELTGREWTDYTFEARFEVDTGVAGFVFRATSKDDLYAWQVETGEAASLSLLVREAGDWRTLADVSLDGSLDPDAPHRFGVELDGDSIVTSIDGTVVDRRTDQTHSAGTIGFRQRSDDRVRIHEVSVIEMGGRDLLSDSFSTVPGVSFDGGVVKDDALVIEGASGRAETALHTDAFDRPSPLLRREFDVSGEVEQARLHVVGLGHYEISLNGDRVGTRVLEPGQTDYDETVLYSTYTVTDQIQQGANAIGAVLGRGRFGELVQNVWYWDDAPWWGDPRLLVELSIDYADGTTQTVVSDETWSLTDGPTRFDSLYGGEVYDARQERGEWTRAGFADEDWESAEVVSEPGGKLVPQRAPPVEVTDQIEPVDICEPEPGVYVADIGQVIAGWAELTVAGDEGTVVTLTLGEKLHDDGTVDVTMSGILGPVQTDQYVLRGGGTETWEPRFSYKGFRYVQIEGIPGEPTADAITAKVVHTALETEDDGHFDCSNDVLAQIHRNTEWAFLNNHHSVPTDTPKYEKNGWTGDAQVTAETGLYNFSMERFYGKWLRDFRDAQRESGELPAIIPTSGWSYSDKPCSWDLVTGVVPETGISSILIPWWMYQYAGDRRLLDRQYDGMKRYLRRLEEHADDQIIRVGLGDWPDAVEGPAIISTAYYYRGAEFLAEIARIVGTDAEARAFESLAAEIVDAFNDEFLDPETGIYRTGTVDEYRQTSNSFPLAFGMVPEDQVASTVEHLVTDVVDARDGHLSTNVFGTKQLLPVLSAHGHHDVAYQVATQTTYPSWGHWIENGHTSLLESWALDCRSFNHHFFGSVVEWFYKYLAGIRPAEPGFRHVTVAPEPVADLDWVDASVDTVRGEVGVHWDRGSDDAGGASAHSLSLDVSIPGNTTASVIVPTLGAERVRLTESGAPVWRDGQGPAATGDGITDADRGDEHVAVEVGSGEFAFELEGLEGA